jgi:7-carboxy-7-deazaguanine synthase
MKKYVVNEVFYSVQGEGMRAGCASVFVRFTGCNLRCDVAAGDKSPGNFACDTEFASGRAVTANELIAWIEHEAPRWHRAGDPTDLAGGGWLVLTGGEPGLQIDEELIRALHAYGYLLAVETNGSIELPPGLDWITVSPKVAEHAIKQRTASEVKYVRGYGQGIPKTEVSAAHRLISPAFDGLTIRPDVLAWCIQLVKEHPEWRLSVQNHKAWTVR